MGEPIESSCNLAEVLEQVENRARVVIRKHQALPSEMKGEYVAQYSSGGTKGGKKLYLFHMDEETTIPEDEQARYRPIIQMHQLPPRRALVIREDELQTIGLQLLDAPPQGASAAKQSGRGVIKCPKCSEEHDAQDLLSSLGLEPSERMTSQAQKVEAELKQSQMPSGLARRWAQQAAKIIGDSLDTALQWVQFESLRKGDEPPGTSCANRKCDYHFGPADLGPWLDSQTRSTLSAEAAMKASGERVEEDTGRGVKRAGSPLDASDTAAGGASSIGSKGASQGTGEFKIPRRSVLGVEGGRGQVGREEDRSPSCLGASVILPTRAWVGAEHAVSSGRASHTSGEGPVTGITSSMFPSLHRPGPLPPRPVGTWGGGAVQRARVEEVERRLVGQLVGMGYAKGRAKRAARGCSTIEDALDRLERQPEEEGKEEVDNTSSASSFEFGDGGGKISLRNLAVASSRTAAASLAVNSRGQAGDRPVGQRPVGPERGLLQPIITVRVTWSYAGMARTAAIDLVKSELPSWEEFKSWCMERLKLDPHEYFVDCIERVTLDYAGSVRDRTEVHSLDGTYAGSVRDRTEVHSLDELLRDWGSGQRVELRTVCLDPTPVQVDNMGREEHIYTLLQEFRDDTAMREQLVQLSLTFPRWRRVRGDGNCYYRALMFGLCEHCLYKPQRMAQLKKLVRDTAALPREVAERLLDWLENHAGREPLEEVFTDQRTGVDEGLIILARLALSDHIRRHKDEPLYGGLSMAQMVEAEDSTIEDYCAAQIERMGVDAEGFQLDLGLLPRILKLTCHTWMVQRNNKQLCQITRPEDGVDRDLEISLLLVPGHYSFLVPPAPGETYDPTPMDTTPMEIDDDAPEDKDTKPSGASENGQPSPPPRPASFIRGDSTESEGSGPATGQNSGGSVENEDKAEPSVQGTRALPTTIIEGCEKRGVTLEALLVMNAQVAKQREGYNPVAASTIAKRCRALGAREVDELKRYWLKALELCDEDEEEEAVKDPVTCSKWLQRLNQALTDLIQKKQSNS